MNPVGKTPIWKKKWAIAVAGIVVVAAIVSANGKGDEKTVSTTVAATTPESVVTTDESTTSTEAAVTTTTTVETTTTVPARPGFGEGVKLVGSDVQPGIYVANVPDDSFGCYWERLSSLSGEFDAILANDNEASGAHVVVEILPEDEAFSSSRCGEWTLFEAPAAPADSFGEGVWLVGSEIVPGRYRSTGDPDSFGCYWQRSSGLSGGFDDIIANDNVTGSGIVDIQAGDVAFVSHGCGTWSLAG